MELSRFPLFYPNHPLLKFNFLSPKRFISFLYFSKTLFLSFSSFSLLFRKESNKCAHVLIRTFYGSFFASQGSLKFSTPLIWGARRWNWGARASVTTQSVFSQLPVINTPSGVSARGHFESASRVDRGALVSALDTMPRTSKKIFNPSDLGCAFLEIGSQRSLKFSTPLIWGARAWDWGARASEPPSQSIQRKKIVANYLVL